MYNSKIEPPSPIILDSEKALEDSIVQDVIYGISAFGSARLIITNGSYIQRDVLLERVNPRILGYIRSTRGQNRIEDFVEISFFLTFESSQEEMNRFCYDLEECLKMIAGYMGKILGREIYVDELFTHNFPQ